MRKYKDLLKGIQTLQKKRKFFNSLEYQNGSTFFKDGYRDYLDENYSEIETNNKSKEANNESNSVDFEKCTCKESKKHWEQFEKAEQEEK